MSRYTAVVLTLLFAIVAYFGARDLHERHQRAVYQRQLDAKWWADAAKLQHDLDAYGRNH